MVNQNKSITAWFRPVYNELNTFIISLASILLLLTHLDLRRMCADVRAMDLLALIPIAAMAIFGAGLSLFNVLVRRPKESWEKTAMAGIAMGANGTAGIACGMELLPQGFTFAAVIPLWNIVTSALLLYQMGIVSEEAVSDEDVTLRQVAMSTGSLLLIFILCEWILKLTWPMTFSVSTAFASVSGHVFRNAWGETESAGG